MLDELKTHLIKFEGLITSPYHCTSGKLTIGVGRNLEDNGISVDEALFLLGNDLENVFKELHNTFPWYEDAPEKVKLVIADMCFNLGLPGLLSFKKMLKAIEEKDWIEAANQILNSRYAEQVGNRAVYNAHLLETTGKDPWLTKLKKGYRTTAD
jgi:lysozyme